MAVGSGGPSGAQGGHGMGGGKSGGGGIGGGGSRGGPGGGGRGSGKGEHGRNFFFEQALLNNFLNKPKQPNPQQVPGLGQGFGGLPFNPSGGQIDNLAGQLQGGFSFGNPFSFKNQLSLLTKLGFFTPKTSAFPGMFPQ